MDETLALALQMSLEDTGAHRAPRNRWAPETSAARSPVQQYVDAQNQGKRDFAQTVAQADAAVEMARRLQEQFDAEAAAEFMRYEEEQGHVERQYQEQRLREQERVHLRGRLFGAEMNDQVAAVHPPAGVPAWLDRTMTEDANNDLLDLAMQASFEEHNYAGFVPARAAQQNAPVRNAPQQPMQQLQAPRQRPYQAPAPAPAQGRPQPRAAAAAPQYPGNPPGVEYDQEDELLARALQDSLDEQVWG
jgi:hypothetical protein